MKLADYFLKDNEHSFYKRMEKLRLKISLSERKLTAKQSLYYRIAQLEETYETNKKINGFKN